MRHLFGIGDVVHVRGFSMMSAGPNDFIGVIRDIDHGDESWPYWITPEDRDSDNWSLDGWYSEEDVSMEPDEVPL